jgi:outer membrane protein OmpA-like peptidoglycan-associated protein
MRSLKPAAIATLASLALSGCSVMQERQWGSCAVGGALIGATAAGIAGGVTANNTGGGNAERGGAIAGGIVGGGLIGALLGHAVCDPVKPPPPPPPVAQAPPPPPPPAKKLAVLEGPEFDFDKATLPPEGRRKVDEAIRVLKENPSMHVSVDGYTDSIGSDAYNLKLSERRARTVADYMIAAGIDRSRLTVRGFGKAHPVASNDTAEGRARNRRVEIVPQ